MNTLELMVNIFEVLLKHLDGKELDDDEDKNFEFGWENFFDLPLYYKD